jgi:phage terminase small subunit
MALTPKQQRFVEEYLIDLNATQAAIRAGFSEATAAEQGYQLLHKTSVIDAIAEAKAARSERTQITADMVVAELARIGFSNMGNYARWNGSGVDLVDSSTLNDDALRCVSEVSQTVTAEGGTVKFKLHDKKGALDSLGRHLGMFQDNLNLKGELSIADRISKARERAGSGKAGDS